MNVKNIIRLLTVVMLLTFVISCAIISIVNVGGPQNHKTNLKLVMKFR